MKTANDIQNRAARFWTTKELNQTKKQAIKNGFTVETSPMGMTKIHDFKNDKLILQAIPMGATRQTVNVTHNYAIAKDPYYIEMYGDFTGLDYRSVILDKSYFEQ